ncbi:amidohydrolase [Colletotrichum karsti]|uniref:Amidohydrolase n=1 Tax=Colletotrichum karsti TaxID=1095194 RepID=A0A9P6IDI5_9PEZI|nr:amidohydrolase [Colletotrichum karsti]KAF9880863.1 amidohydrolase [Colletotrichum karsti]
MLVQDGKVRAIGSRDEVLPKDMTGLQIRDLHQRTVLPGFIDGHMHLLLLGQSLRKLDLVHCKTIDDIRSTIKAYAAANPDVPTILCKNWMHTMTPDGVSAALLDDIDARPIFIDASSQHSCWCNSAALDKLGAADMADPPGGSIHRDADGKPTGVLDEGAMMSVIWPFQAASAPKEERIQAIKAAILEYNAAGYTGVVEMAMDEEAWDSLVTLKDNEPELSIRVSAYWLIKPTADFTANSKQVQRAIELSKLYNSSTSPDLRIVGVKVICDGIIDACTAFLSQPYAPAGLPPPIWEREHLEAVVKEADAGGVQVALHAIGDAAIRMAIDAVEKNGTKGRRHRIEHLELASPEDAQRLGRLGLTASIHPVHADPSILTEWPRLLGEGRCKRAFAYREFADAGALMAIGSDSPTSPWAPMHNLYVASTRHSSRDPSYTKTVNEHFKLGLWRVRTLPSWGTPIILKSVPRMMIRSRNIVISILSKRPTIAASAPSSCVRSFSQSPGIMSQTSNGVGGKKPVNFGIVVFPAFQALDVFGPLDALNLLSRNYEMNLSVIAETRNPVSTKQVPGAQQQPGAIPAAAPAVPQANSDFGQTILPTHTFQTAPPLDVLIVPGGQGTRYAGIRTSIDFVKERFPELQYLITVCTGAGVAARAGVLDGKRATTNKLSWDQTIALRPEVNWVHKARWVEDGNVWTSSGISAGIDVTFAWIRAVYGNDVGKNVADRMEYTPVEDSSWDPFADLWGKKKTA